MPKSKQERAHGTPQRYWQDCRCQLCKDAISKYLRDRKGGAAAPARKRETKPVKTARTVPQRAKRIPADLNLGALTAKIGALRADLAQAEEQLRDAIKATVENVFPGWTFAPSEVE